MLRCPASHCQEGGATFTSDDAPPYARTGGAPGTRRPPEPRIRQGSARTHAAPAPHENGVRAGPGTAPPGHPDASHTPRLQPSRTPTQPTSRQTTACRQPARSTPPPEPGADTPHAAPARLRPCSRHRTGRRPQSQVVFRCRRNRSLMGGAFQGGLAADRRACRSGRHSKRLMTGPAADRVAAPPPTARPPSPPSADSSRPSAPPSARPPSPACRPSAPSMPTQAGRWTPAAAATCRRRRARSPEPGISTTTPRSPHFETRPRRAQPVSPRSSGRRRPPPVR